MPLEGGLGERPGLAEAVVGRLVEPGVERGRPSACPTAKPAAARPTAFSTVLRPRASRDDLQLLAGRRRRPGWMRELCRLCRLVIELSSAADRGTERQPVPEPPDCGYNTCVPTPQLSLSCRSIASRFPESSILLTMQARLPASLIDAPTWTQTVPSSTMKRSWKSVVVLT